MSCPIQQGDINHSYVNVYQRVRVATVATQRISSSNLGSHMWQVKNDEDHLPLIFWFT